MWVTYVLRHSRYMPLSQTNKTSKTKHQCTAREREKEEHQVGAVMNNKGWNEELEKGRDLDEVVHLNGSRRPLLELCQKENDITMKITIKSALV